MLDPMTTPIVLKRMEPIRVVYMTHTGAWNDVGLTFLEFVRTLSAQGVHPMGPFLVLHDQVPSGATTRIRVDVAAPVSRAARPGRGLALLDLPEVEVASIIFDGPPARLGEAFRALERWLRHHGYARAGPYREIHAPDLSDLPPGIVHAEIQVPVTYRGADRPTVPA